LKHPSLFN